MCTFDIISQNVDVYHQFYDKSIVVLGLESIYNVCISLYNLNFVSLDSPTDKLFIPFYY